MAIKLPAASSGASQASLPDRFGLGWIKVKPVCAHSNKSSQCASEQSRVSGVEIVGR